jgi:hypothetical protein
VEQLEGKKFDEIEVAEVIARYPGLRQTSPGVLEGVIEIHHQYDTVARRDRFSIQLAAHQSSSRLPALREVGGRSKAIVLKHGFEDVRAVHQNLVDGTACVCVKQEEVERFPPGTRLVVFLERLAIPYLFGLSYVDEFGDWPWGEYSHGGLGLIEFYADNTGQISKEEFGEVLASLRAHSNWPDYHRQLKKPSAKRACICGSGKAFGKCHHRAWRGLKNLISGLKQLGLDPKSLQK